MCNINAFRIPAGRDDVYMSEYSDIDLIIKELRIIRKALEEIKLDNVGKSEFERMRLR
jgi:hypothetical protein